MATVIKLNYADLSAIVGKFRNEAQDIDGLLKQTKGKVESLHNNQWIGEAADKYFQRNGTTCTACSSQAGYRPGYRR